MEALGPSQIIFCAAVITAAFAVRSGAGFGGGAVAVPFLALVLPLQIVVPVVVILNMLSSVGHGIRAWRNIEWAELLRLFPFTLAGIGIGIYLLAQLDPRPLRRALGVFVSVYAIYAIATAGHAWTIARRWLVPFGATMSFAAGFVGALFGGAAGPFYVMYLNALKLSRDSFRVTITTMMLLQGLVRIGGYAGLGFYDVSSLALLVASLPPMLLGSYIGVRLVQRYDQTKFNRVVGGVVLISGAALLFK